MTTLTRPGGLNSTVSATVAAFGALSARARSIGILRWLIQGVRDAVS